jgi:hypothetical protein
MNINQLLALAAKAHGGLLYIKDMGAWIHVDKDGNRGAWWNPLDDDGDAFRLAVTLKICIEFYSHGVDVWRGSERDCRPYDDDAARATRLAIVNVAAQIGEDIE